MPRFDLGNAAYAPYDAAGVSLGPAKAFVMEAVGVHEGDVEMQGGAVLNAEQPEETRKQAKGQKAAARGEEERRDLKSCSWTFDSARGSSEGLCASRRLYIIGGGLAVLVGAALLFYLLAKSPGADTASDEVDPENKSISVGELSKEKKPPPVQVDPENKSRSVGELSKENEPLPVQVEPENKSRSVEKLSTDNEPQPVQAHGEKPQSASQEESPYANLPEVPLPPPLLPPKRSDNRPVLADFQIFSPPRPPKRGDPRPELADHQNATACQQGQKRPLPPTPRAFEKDNAYLLPVSGEAAAGAAPVPEPPPKAIRVEPVRTYSRTPAVMDEAIRVEPVRSYSRTPAVMDEVRRQTKAAKLPPSQHDIAMLDRNFGGIPPMGPQVAQAQTFQQGTWQEDKEWLAKVSQEANDPYEEISNSSRSNKETSGRPSLFKQLWKGITRKIEEKKKKEKDQKKLEISDQKKLEISDQKKLEISGPVLQGPMPMNGEVQPPMPVFSQDLDSTHL